ncbi:MAG: signal peptide peptidase SppA [Bacteroidota bacterium]
MKDFFKFLFASCLGTFVALFLLFFVIVGSIGAIAGAGQQPVSVAANSVLHLKFDKPVPELTDNVQPTDFEFKPVSTPGLSDIVATIETAANDDNIKGIFLEPGVMMIGFTQTAVVRQALLDFKDSGKFIYAYSPSYTQNAYYLSSVADELYLAPMGIVDFRGFSTTPLFFKDAMDRLNIDAEVFYAGKYKSASEPFRRNSMSEESKDQTRILLNDLYRQLRRDIASARNLSPETVDALASDFTGLDTDAAQSSGLVDKIAYREALLDKMREAIGLDEDEKIKSVDVLDYLNGSVEKGTSGERIAVLYAEGNIIDGESEPSQIGDVTYVEMIEKIRKDDDIKALVLRINSGGGSAMSSDHIWRALMDLKTTGKPLVVSMGSVAASGGYYIAAPADHIYAEESTITGSIGVVAPFPQMQNFFKQTLGLHFDSVRTHPYATGLNPIFDLSPSEKAKINALTQRTYKLFKERVAEGRGMDTSAVQEIAQGRVWMANDAQRVGLVDEIGGLDEAIEKAAGLADLDEYQTVDFPKAKPPFERLLEDFTEINTMYEQRQLRKQLGSAYPYYQYVQEVTQTAGVQARMPFLWLDK